MIQKQHIAAGLGLAVVVLSISFLSPEAVGQAAPSTALPYSLFGRKIADLARSLVGCRYRWGGISPQTGFDCSGFVSYVVGRCGLPLPHSAGAQQKRGRPVRIDALQPGDLMFFRMNGAAKINHVAIFLGDSQYIAATDEAHGLVIFPIGPEGRASFAGGCRLAPSCATAPSPVRAPHHRPHKGRTKNH